MKSHTFTLLLSALALLPACPPSVTAADPLTDLVRAGRRVRADADALGNTARSRANDIDAAGDPNLFNNTSNLDPGASQAQIRADMQRERDQLNGFANERQALMNAQQNELNALAAQLRNPPPGASVASLQAQMRNVSAQIQHNRNQISEYRARAQNFQNALDGRPTTRSSGGSNQSDSPPSGPPPPDLDGGYATGDDGRIYLPGSDEAVRGWIVDQQGNLVRDTVQGISRDAGRSAAERSAQAAAQDAAQAAARDQARNSGAGSPGHVGGVIPRGPRHIRPPPTTTVCPPAHP